MPYQKTNLTLYSSPLEQPRPFSRDASDINNSLAHHGIGGMKWGIWNEETQRKYTGGGKQGGQSLKGTFKRGVKIIKTSMQKVGDRIEKRKSAAAQDKKNKAAARLKKVSPEKIMSDEELKNRIARLKLEKEYRQLTTEQISTGKKLVRDALTKGLSAGLESGIKGALTALAVGPAQAKLKKNEETAKKKGEAKGQVAADKIKSGTTVADKTKKASANAVKYTAKGVKKAWEHRHDISPMDPDFWREEMRLR